MNNGIIGNLGASKRSICGIAAMGMLMTLNTSDGKYAALAMWLITLLAVAYMIMDEIKDRRHVNEH